MNNNAFAARKVAEDGDKTQAAIAGAHAAETYGLERAFFTALSAKFPSKSIKKRYSQFRSSMGRLSILFIFRL